MIGCNLIDNFWVFGDRCSRLDVEQAEMVVPAYEDHVHFPVKHFERESSWVASTTIAMLILGLAKKPKKLCRKYAKIVKP